MAAATIFDRVVFCARETTKGTNGFATPNETFAATVTEVNAAITATPTNSDKQAVKVRTVKVAPSMTSIDRPTIKGSMGNSPNIIGKKMVQVDIEFELKGSSAAGTAPEYTPMLEACGVSTALVATTSCTFAPASTTTTLTQGVTLRVYHDGMVYDVTGCAGTATVDMTIGNIILVQATFQGAYNAPAVQAIGALTSVPFDTTVPIVGDVADVISDGATIKTAAFKMDLGNDVQEHYVTGDHQFSVANRNPTLTLTKDSIGTATEWSALAAGTNAAISGTFNAAGAAGNKLAFSGATARRSAVAYNERAERDILDVTYGLFESAGGAGNDQWSFQFT